jgi:hemerythrin superfamily protein
MEFREEASGTRQTMLRDQRAEVEAWRTQAREEFRTALEARREQLETRLEEHRVEREQRREELKARLSEEAQERLGGYAERMAERMNTILDHLTSIADRIASRIEKLETEHGVDLFEASDALDEAYELIDTAKEDVAKLVALVDDALTSDDPKAYMDEVREAAGVAKESIRAVHRALSDAVVGVRAGTPEDKPEDEEPEEESAE